MPRRAIIYICWGQKYLANAVVSAGSAGFLRADRILITTPDSLTLLPPNPPFTKTITHTFSLPGLLAKSEMIYLLPEDYDSFLFLDADTQILMDITNGFEKAEQHGIAAAVAPNYSLEHFWDFGKILDRIGFPRVDTLQYNTGVLFFIRRPDIWRILKDWHELCRDVGLGIGYANDQPFFTLAMERQGFNPYTLSPGYNYRNLGEHISGLVRVWHSNLPPPPDVNVFIKPWPPRSFKNGVRSG
jgi:hypothetical protein